VGDTDVIGSPVSMVGAAEVGMAVVGAPVVGIEVGLLVVGAEVGLWVVGLEELGLAVVGVPVGEAEVLVLEVVELEVVELEVVELEVVELDVVELEVVEVVVVELVVVGAPSLAMMSHSRDCPGVCWYASCCAILFAIFAMAASSMACVCACSVYSISVVRDPASPRKMDSMAICASCEGETANSRRSVASTCKSPCVYVSASS